MVNCGVFIFVGLTRSPRLETPPQRLSRDTCTLPCIQLFMGRLPAVQAPNLQSPAATSCVQAHKTPCLPQTIRWLLIGYSFSPQYAFKTPFVRCAGGLPLLDTTVLPARVGKPRASAAMGECSDQHGGCEEHSEKGVKRLCWQVRHYQHVLTICRN